MEHVDEQVSADSFRAIDEAMQMEMEIEMGVLAIWLI